MNRNDQAGVVMSFIVWLLISKWRISQGLLTILAKCRLQHLTQVFFSPCTRKTHSLLGGHCYTLGISQSFAGDNRRIIQCHLCSGVGISCKDDLYRSWFHSTGRCPSNDWQSSRTTGNACHVFSLPNLQTAIGASLSYMQSMYIENGSSLSLDE
jgi:hypothetical protein